MADWRSTVPLRTLGDATGIGATMVAVATKVQKLNVDLAQAKVTATLEAEMERFRNKTLARPASEKVPTTYVRGSSPESHVNDQWVVGNQYTDTVGGRGFAVDIFNKVSYAHWVYGDNQGNHQLGYHVNTGWPNMFREFIKAKPRIYAAAAAAFKEWADEGGV